VKAKSAVLNKECGVWNTSTQAKVNPGVSGVAGGLVGQSRPPCQDVHCASQLPAHNNVNLLTPLVSTDPQTNPNISRLSLIVVDHGADQGAERSRALSRPQQVRNLAARSFGLDLTSHERTQYIRIRRIAADAKYPEPAEFGRVCSAPHIAGDLRLGNMGGLQV
jgi:hypothetical protein